MASSSRHSLVRPGSVGSILSEVAEDDEVIEELSEEDSVIDEDFDYSLDESYEEHTEDR